MALEQNAKFPLTWTKFQREQPQQLRDRSDPSRAGGEQAVCVWLRAQSRLMWAGLNMQWVGPQTIYFSLSLFLLAPCSFLFVCLSDFLQTWSLMTDNNPPPALNNSYRWMFISPPFLLFLFNLLVQVWHMQTTQRSIWKSTSLFNHRISQSGASGSVLLQLKTPHFRK